MLTSQFFGRLTQNPTVQYTGSGNAYCSCSLAVNDDYRNKEGKWVERVYFFDFKLWGKTAERAAEKYHKGMMLYVEAKPTQDRWDDAEGNKRSRVIFDVRHIEDIERFGRRGAAEPSGDKNDYTPPAAAAQDAGNYEDADIPF